MSDGRLLKHYRAIWTVFFVVFGVIVARILVNLYTDSLWFEEVGYPALFWKPIAYRLLAAFLGALIAFGIFVSNYLVARKSWELPRFSFTIGQGEIPAFLAGRDAVRYGFKTIIGIVVMITALAVSHRGPELMWLVHKEPFGLADPLFGADVSFYFFSLPVLRSVTNLVLTEVILSFVLVMGIYLASGSIRFGATYLSISVRAREHMTVLIAVILTLLGCQQALAQYGILFSTRGAVFGAGYTDSRVVLLATRVLVVALLASALVAALSVKRFRWKVLVTSVLIVAGIAILLRGVAPAVLQEFYVKLNAAVLEQPYVEHNISLTRAAYGLERVREAEFESGELGDVSSLVEDEVFAESIPLWNPDSIVEMYRQLQGVRPFYEFSEVDTDRYYIGGRYRQVMLAAREMDAGSLPDTARTWTDEHLTYTHGYGVCMSAAGKASEDGLPFFHVGGIPLMSPAGLEVTRPQIYYGERTQQYVIVGSAREEFDYPGRESTVYGRYHGSGGIAVGSLLRRLSFAWRLNSIELALSSDIMSESRLLLDRSVLARVRRIAPFLYFDSDCYPVLADGKVFWIVDAYAVSFRFPYSTPVPSGINYIRNSIKAVVDAYDGSVTFYNVAPEEPVARMYAKCFPEWLRDSRDMNPEIRAHLRYPRALFTVQAETYARYHVTGPAAFYNKEDVWAFPRRSGAAPSENVKPYYATAKLPQEDSEEFLLLMPLTKAGRDNVVACFCARCDGEAYGTLLCLKFSEKNSLYGPLSVEALLERDPRVTSELSRLAGEGRQVVGGDLLPVPFGSAVLYVKPFYVRAGERGLLQLTQVAVSDGRSAAMRTNLFQALNDLLASGDVLGASTASRGAEEGSGSRGGRTRADRALQYLEEARRALREGSWELFGRKMDALEKLLRELKKE